MHGYKWESAALLVETVNRSCDYLLAGTCFSLKQNRGVADLGSFVGALQHRMHALGGSDEPQSEKEFAKRVEIGGWSGHNHHTAG